MVRTTTQNPAIQKGVGAVYALNADTVLREQIRQRDKAVRDYENEMAIARSEGKAEGREEGIAEGMAKGKKEGREEGIAEGIAKGKKEGIEKGRVSRESEIAENLRKMGMTEEQIKKALEM